MRSPGRPMVPATKRSGGSKMKRRRAIVLTLYRFARASGSRSADPRRRSCASRARRRGRAGSGARSWTVPVPSVARTIDLRDRRVSRPSRATHWTHVASAMGRDEPCLMPVAVDRDLDLARCRGRAPRRSPAIGDVPGAEAARRARRVDAGLGQDRRLLGPAERDPVAVERLEGRQLELGQPFGRRDVAVQARARSGEPGSRGSAAAARRSSGGRSSARAPGP